MKAINWIRLTDEPEGEAPPPPDPEVGRTRERPALTRDVLERDELRDSAEHKVLRNIARTYVGYYGPKLD